MQAGLSIQFLNGEWTSYMLQILKGHFVNIVDLVDAVDSGTLLVIKFTTRLGLSKYTRRTGQIFDRTEAKADPLLKAFLIKL